MTTEIAQLMDRALVDVATKGIGVRIKAKARMEDGTVVDVSIFVMLTDKVHVDAAVVGEIRVFDGEKP